MKLSNTYPEGTKIYSTNGKETGTVVSTGDWSCACGSKGKLRVVWSDHQITLLCPKGLVSYQDGFKIS